VLQPKPRIFGISEGIGRHGIIRKVYPGNAFMSFNVIVFILTTPLVLALFTISWFIT
jgi:hypothetical protein